MATIDDIGVPGQPLNTPPLTAWQAAVRDSINGSAAVTAGTIAPASGWTYTRSIARKRAGFVTVSITTSKSTAPTAGETIGTLPAGYRAATGIEYHGVGLFGATSTTIVVSVDAAGGIRLRSSPLPGAATSLAFHITYPAEN